MAITLTAEQFKNRYGQNVVNKFNATSATPEPPPEKPGLLSQIGSKLMARGSDIVNTFKDTAAGKINPLETGIQTVGAIAGGGNDIVGSTIGAGIGAIANATPEPVKKTATQAGLYLLQTPMGKEAIKALSNGVDTYKGWAAANPRAAKDFEAVVNIAEFIPTALAINSGVNAVKETVPKIVQGAKDFAGNVVDKAQTIGAGIMDSKAGQAVKDIGGNISESVSAIPRRVSANVDASQAAKATIDSLPTAFAKQAAQDGVDPTDVKFLYSVPNQEKTAFGKLADVAKTYSTDSSAPNPIQTVGASITKRIKSLDSVRKDIGAQLGDVAQNLGDVSSKDLIDPVLSSMQKVPGLKGLDLTPKGTLNFSNTAMASDLSKADQTLLQRAFAQATKSGTGTQKHLFRQELFDLLDGKKNSLQALSGTQEQGLNAIRSGLSTVLEGQNSEYKALSNAYREAIQPLGDMRKLMKTIPGASGDILDMQGGLLARRLTSNAVSNPQIRNILDTMDQVLQLNGQSVPVSTARLQEFYNLLDKYYNLAGKTSFQGQVTAGVEKAGGIKGAIINAAKSFAGKTDAVTQRALEKAISEALAGTFSVK